MRKISVSLMLIGGLLMGHAGLAFAARGDTVKVTVCHETGSDSNPYIKNVVSVKSVDDANGLNGHGNHEGDIWASFVFNGVTYLGQGDPSTVDGDCNVVPSPTATPTDVAPPTATDVVPPTATPTDAPTATPTDVVPPTATDVMPPTATDVVPPTATDAPTVTPVDPTPVDPTPVDPTPVDPTPVDPTPVDPTPVDSTPVGPTPTNAPTATNPPPGGCNPQQRIVRVGVYNEQNGALVPMAGVDVTIIFQDGTYWNGTTHADGLTTFTETDYRTAVSVEVAGYTVISTVGLPTNGSPCGEQISVLVGQATPNQTPTQPVVEGGAGPRSSGSLPIGRFGLGFVLLVVGAIGTFGSKRRA